MAAAKNKIIRVEWCENFIRSIFARIPFEDPRIDVKLDIGLCRK